MPALAAMQVSTRAWVASLLLAKLATRRVVAPTDDTAVERSAPLSIHRGYAEPFDAGPDRSPALMPREV
jgi:hypothetical protein